MLQLPTCSAFVTSHVTCDPLAPSSISSKHIFILSVVVSKSASIMLALSLANALAVAEPMSPAAPVITAFLLVNFYYCLSIEICYIVIIDSV